MYKGKYSQPRTPVLEETPVCEPELTEEQIIAEVHESEKEEKPPVKQPKKKKKSGKVFYTIYAIFTVLLIAAAVVAMFLLRNFLVKFQASRPEEKSREVYAQLFTNPDWAALYEKAGLEDTAFESKEAFTAYMNQQVEGKTLGFLETANGLSKDHKYIVRADQDKVAAFTLVNTVADPNALPEWTLGDVELFYERTQSVTVEKDPDWTVYVNDVALDESYTTIKEITAAEDYLPEGIHSYRKDTQFVDGFLVAPTVTCQDRNGVQVTLTQGEDGVYRAEAPQTEEATQEQKDLAVTASKYFGSYSIQQLSSAELKTVYDPASQLYKDIIGVDLFTRDFQSYSFDEKNMVISEYHRYSETLYSIRVNLTMVVRLDTGNLKDFPSDRTYFFEEKADGQVLVIAATNTAIHDVKRQVRLDFTYDGKTESVFVDANTKSVQLPEVTVPEGQVLTGWAWKTQDENGKNVLTVVITPGDGGFGIVSGTLQPMVLQPMFEKAGT